MTNAWDQMTICHLSMTHLLLLHDLSGRCCNKPACEGDPIGFSWLVVFMCANCFLSASAILFCWEKMNAKQLAFAEDPRNERPPRTKQSISSLPSHCAVVTVWELLPWHSSVDVWSPLIILLLERWLCGIEDGRTCTHCVSLRPVVFLNLKLILKGSSYYFFFLFLGTWLIILVQFSKLS